MHSTQLLLRSYDSNKQIKHNTHTHIHIHIHVYKSVCIYNVKKVKYVSIRVKQHAVFYYLFFSSVSLRHPKRTLRSVCKFSVLIVSNVPLLADRLRLIKLPIFITVNFEGKPVFNGHQTLLAEIRQVVHRPHTELQSGYLMTTRP